MWRCRLRTEPAGMPALPGKKDARRHAEATPLQLPNSDSGFELAAVYCGMAHVLALNYVDNIFGYVRGMVADAF